MDDDDDDDDDGGGWFWMENPMNKWMITRGSPILGHLHDPCM